MGRTHRFEVPIDMLAPRMRAQQVEQVRVPACQAEQFLCPARYEVAAVRARDVDLQELGVRSERLPCVLA